MPERDTETIGRAIEAFNRRDIEAFAACSHPEIELVPLRAAVEDTVYRGHRGLVDFDRDSEDAWKVLRVEETRIEDLGGGRLLVFGTLVGRGRGSGAPTRAELVWSVRMRDGLIWRFATHPDRAGALDTLGDA